MFSVSFFSILVVAIYCIHYTHFFKGEVFLLVCGTKRIEEEFSVYYSSPRVALRFPYQKFVPRYMMMSIGTHMFIETKLLRIRQDNVKRNLKKGKLLRG